MLEHVLYTYIMCYAFCSVLSKVLAVQVTVLIQVDGPGWGGRPGGAWRSGAVGLVGQGGWGGGPSGSGWEGG